MSDFGSEFVQWFSHPGAEKQEPCGIFIPKAGDRPAVSVPLKRRDVRAKIYTNGKFSDTKETLTYCSDVDCCAVFRFPLPPRSAVYKFRALLGDREISTKVKPRDEAREEYNLAVQQGHTAVHLSQHERGASVFEVSLGNLLAGETVVVELSYLRLLDSFGATLEWSHVATWVPPYIGSKGDEQAGVDKVTMELPVFAHKVSYSLSYDLKILADEQGAVRNIDSPQPVKVVPHAASDNGSDGAAVSSGPTGLQGGGGGGSSSSTSCWSVSLSDQVADPSRDLTLTLEMDPRVVNRNGLFLQRAPPATEGGEARTFALATFVPPALPPLPPPPSQQQPQQQPDEAQQEQQQQPQPQQQPLCNKELWFILDCSGSMQGAPMQQARESALLFVRDLPSGAGVKFNVSCFGSGHKSLYGQCMPYNADTEREAVAWIQRNADAYMGGTEILSVLAHVYGSCLTPGYSREVIFLTDGGISGHEEGLIYDLITPPPPSAEVQQQASEPAADGPGAQGDTGCSPLPGGGQRPHDGDDKVWQLRGPTLNDTTRRTHVLCLGIGDGVHRGLLDGIARRTGGLAAYVVGDEAIAAKTAFLKKAALARGGAVRPRLVTHGSLVRPAPHVLPQRMFAGEPLLVLLEVVRCEPDGSLELRAEEPTGAAEGLGQGQGRGQGRGAGGQEAGEGDAAGGGDPVAPPPGLRLELPLGRAVGGEMEAGEALGVLHAMAYIDSLMAGTSPLHVHPDGTSLPTPPSDDLVRQTIMRTAVAANLVTPYTSAVGVSLRRDPADPAAATRLAEVPLQVPYGRTLWQQQSQRQLGGMFGGHRRALQMCAAAPSGCAPFPPAVGAAAFASPFGPAQMAMPARAPVPFSSPWTSTTTPAVPTALFGARTQAAPFGATSQGFGATSQAFGATSQAFGATAQAFGASTQAFGATSQAFGATSQAFGASTQAFGATSQAFGATAQAFGATSQAFGASTQAFGASTQAFGASTQAFGATAQAFGATAQAFGATAQAFGASTQAFGASTQAFGASTQAFGASTQAFGASTQAFGASTQAFGATPQAAAFGATAPFGATPQASLFGAVPQAAAFGASTQAAAFGTSTQASLFGASTQAAPFGAIGVPPPASLFGARTHEPSSSATQAAPKPGSGVSFGSFVSFGASPDGVSEPPRKGAINSFGGNRPAGFTAGFGGICSAQASPLNPHQPGEAAAVCTPPHLSGGSLLSFLNLHRTTEGYWRAGPQLATALGLPLEGLLTAAGAGRQQGDNDSPVIDQQQQQQQEKEATSSSFPSSSPPPLAALRPAGLCDDGWATLVVLAVLRRRLASQPEVWADMQAKALTWLEARWPAGGQGRSVGAAVLAVARALAA